MCLTRDFAHVRRTRSTRSVLVLALIATAALGCDLIGPGEACTLELRTNLHPHEQTITIGQTFTATVELSSCGGRKRLTDSFTWQAENPAIVQVDAAEGRITGRAAGETIVEVSGHHYGRVGAVRVIVTDSAL